MKAQLLRFDEIETLAPAAIRVDDGTGLANYSYRVFSFGACEGGPTHCGHLVMALNPQMLGGAQFPVGLEAMLLAMQQTPAVRLPGDRRLQARAQHHQTIAVASELVALLRRYGVQGSPMAAQ